MPGRVLVIGDVMTDIVVMPDGPARRGSDTKARIIPGLGGSGANQAVWLATLGAPVRLAARVGAADAETVSASFQARGVEPRLTGDPALPTGTLICLVDSDGERSFLTDRGANAALCPDDLPDALLDEAALLHISGYALFEPGPRAAVLALMRTARDADIPISIDPASTGFLQDVGPDAFLNWCRSADYIFPNTGEAALLTGANEPEDQCRALLDHVPAVVLKRGGEGAVLARRSGARVHMPALPASVVDTTGAGDAFLAGFIAALLDGRHDAACLAAGIAAGARAVASIGGQPGPDESNA